VRESAAGRQSGRLDRPGFPRREMRLSDTTRREE
jgi:hypothetical protein